MDKVKKCRCIKETTNKDIEVGKKYKFSDSGNRKELYLNKNAPLEHLFFSEEYFNEHFEIV